MIYPQGKVIHQNLSAEYTDVPQLLSTLKGNGFSGVVEIEANATKGAFFLVAGRLVNAVMGVDLDPPSSIGDNAMFELFALAGQPHGLLNVFELSAAEVEMATGNLAGELVHKDLSTDFIRMDQFVKKLGNEKHTGYIDISGKDGNLIGVLFLRSGDVVGLQLISASGEKTAYEGESIQTALEYAVRNGAVFNVYRSSGLSDAANDSIEAAVPTVNSSPVVQSAPPPPPPPPPPPAMEPEPVIEPVQIEAPQPAGEPVFEEVNAAQSFVAAEPAAAAPVQEVDDHTAANRRGEFITDLQRVLAKLESFTDHIGSKGDFQRLFRQISVDRSDNYHFLDPFEGQFEYDAGKVRISDSVKSEDFAAATAQCLNSVLTIVNKDFLKGAALPPGLKGEIESAFRYYKDAIKDSGLQSVVPANMR